MVTVPESLSPGAASTPKTAAPVRLRPADRAILGMLGFCLLIGFTLELYWIVYRDQLVALAPTNFIANLFRIYGDADSTYFQTLSPLSMALETINVFATQALNLWLIWAILKARPYRHALQLGIASYLTYSVVLYFWTEHLNGYGHMQERTPWLYFLYFAPNLPWLLFHAYMVWDSCRAITRRFSADTAR